MLAIAVPTALFIYANVKRMFFKSTAAISNSVVNSLPVFEWSEINARIALGAKWIIVGDALIDVSKLIKTHPGKLLFCNI